MLANKRQHRRRNVISAYSMEIDVTFFVKELIVPVHRMQYQVQNLHQLLLDIAGAGRDESEA
jgi:hypothetical protein